LFFWQLPCFDLTTIQKITGNAKTIIALGVKTVRSIAGLVLVFGLAALAGLASPEIKSIALAILAVRELQFVLMLLRVGARIKKAQTPSDSGILTFSSDFTPFILLMEVW
jgi:hypothetical protein